MELSWLPQVLSVKEQERLWVESEYSLSVYTRRIGNVKDNNDKKTTTITSTSKK